MYPSLLRYGENTIKKDAYWSSETVIVNKSAGMCFAGRAFLLTASQYEVAESSGLLRTYGGMCIIFPLTHF